MEIESYKKDSTIPDNNLGYFCYEVYGKKLKCDGHVSYFEMNASNKRSVTRSESTNCDEEDDEFKGVIKFDYSSLTPRYIHHDIGLKSFDLLFRKHCNSTKVPKAMKILKMFNLDMMGESTSLMNWIYRWSFHPVNLYQLNPLFTENGTFQKLFDLSHLVEIEIAGLNLEKDFLLEFYKYMFVDADNLTMIYANNVGNRDEYRTKQFSEEILQLYDQIELQSLNFPEAFFCLTAESYLTNHIHHTKKYYISFNTIDMNDDTYEERFGNNRLFPAYFLSELSVPEHTYNVKFQSNQNYFMPAQTKLCQLRRVLIFDSLISFLIKINKIINIEEKGLADISFQIDYQFSANPIFHVSDILLYKDIDTDSLRSTVRNLHYRGRPSYSCLSVVVAGEDDDDTPRNLTNQEMSDHFCKYMFQLAKFWRRQESKDDKSIRSMALTMINGNRSQQDDIKRLQELLNECFKETGKEENFKDKKVSEVDAIIRECLEIIANRGISAERLLEKLWNENIKLFTNKGHVLRTEWTRIETQVKNFENHFKKHEKKPVIKERRIVVKDFILHNIIKGKCHKEEIDNLKNMRFFKEMTAAIGKWLILVMEIEPIYSLYDILLTFTQKTFSSKVPGLFMSGPSNYDGDNKNQSFDKDFIIVTDKIVEIYCHFILHEEFGKGGFKSGLSQSDYNKLFNWCCEYFSLNVKHYICLIKSKAMVVGVSHYTLEEIFANNDASFDSRFQFIDLNKPIFKKGHPQKEATENVSDYYKKCLRKGPSVAVEKPLFPIMIQHSSKKVNVESESDQFFKKYDCEEAVAVDSKKHFKQRYIDREKSFNNNEYSKEWKKFPELTQVQASYLLYHVLFDFFDMIWLKKDDEKREFEIPISSSTNQTYNHKDFSRVAFSPKLRLEFIELLDRQDLTDFCDKYIKKYPEHYQKVI